MTDFALIKDASLKRVKAGEPRAKAGKFALNAQFDILIRSFS